MLEIDGELHLADASSSRASARCTIRSRQSGAPALLLEHYAGWLEYHDPWHEDREISHLFRGQIDAAEADELLRERGLGHLRLVDNGVLRQRSDDARAPRAAALLPPDPGRRLEGRRGRAPHARARVARARTPSPSATRARTSPSPASSARSGSSPTRSSATRRSREALRAHANVRVAEAGHGAGVYEAVITTLAERR